MNRRIKSKEEFVEEFLLFRAIHPERKNKPQTRPKKKPSPKIRANDRRRFKLNFDDVVRMYLHDNMTRCEIAEQYGCSIKTVQKFLTREGIRKTCLKKKS